MDNFMKTQIENMTNIQSDEKKEFQEPNPAVNSEKNEKSEKSEKNEKKIKKEKKKKKKKIGTYKKLLRSIKKSKKTEQEQKDAYRERLKQSLGGGSFTKISSI